MTFYLELIKIYLNSFIKNKLSINNIIAGQLHSNKNWIAIRDKECL